MPVGILMKLKITGCCHVDCDLTMEAGLIIKTVTVDQMVLTAKGDELSLAIISIETGVQNKRPGELVMMMWTN